jgi:tRNA dimethylallyltransferase
MLLPDLDPDKPVLLAGPTASGKSSLAMEIAQKQGGVIVNADASQIYDCWQVVTARPSRAEEEQLPHRLYGHVAYDGQYSAGHWLREVKSLLEGAERPIIVGGTGLYFSALTEGLAEIPATPDEIRKHADSLTLEVLLAHRSEQPRQGATRLGGLAGLWPLPGGLARRHACTHYANRNLFCPGYG